MIYGLQRFMNGKPESCPRHAPYTRHARACVRAPTERSCYRSNARPRCNVDIAFNIVALRCTWPGRAVALLCNSYGWLREYRKWRLVKFMRRTATIEVSPSKISQRLQEFRTTYLSTLNENLETWPWIVRALPIYLYREKINNRSLHINVLNFVRFNVSF